MIPLSRQKLIPEQEAGTMKRGPKTCLKCNRHFNGLSHKICPACRSIRIISFCYKCFRPVFQGEVWTLCRSCSMKGKKNRTPTYQVGDIWWSGNQMVKKQAPGKIIPYARHLMQESLGRDLLPNEVVKFKDNDPRNCQLDNLYIKTNRPPIGWSI